MDQHDLEASEMTSNARRPYDQQKLETFGKLKSSSDCYEKCFHGNAEIGKQGHECDHEINSYKGVSLAEMESKCLNCDPVSSSDCTTIDANNLKQPCSAVSTSRSSVLKVGMHKKGGSAEGISGEILCNKLVLPSTCQHRFAGDENSNNGEISAHFIEGIDSMQQVCIKSSIKLETGRPFKKEISELDLGKRKENVLNTAEDGLTSIMEATFHDKQLKTESSSSNSSHVFFPASSYDSCQGTSLDAKSCKDSNSFCTPFKRSQEEPAVKRIMLGTETKIAPREVLESSIFLPRKQAGEASDTVGNGGEKVLGIIADLIVEKMDIPNFNLPKRKNEELTSPGKLKLPCEVDDPLEAVSVVAREAKPLVSMYREASGCSSSMEEKTGETVHLSSIDSSKPDKKECLMETGLRSKSYSAQDKSESFCSTKVFEEDPETSVKNEQLCMEMKKQSRDWGLRIVCESKPSLYGQGSSQLATAPKDVVAGGFDLNEGILADESEYPKQLVNETSSSFRAVNVSTPIAVVAKSGFPMCLPMPPLQFEGGLGWKGSAATSAFRPAALCRSPVGHKTSSNNDKNHSSEESKGLKGFDLNIAAEEFPLEVNPTRAERPNLDLNCLSENENCESSPPVSLSRNCIRDIDLNSNNHWFEDTSKDARSAGQGSQLLRGIALDRANSCMRNVRQGDGSSVKPAYWADLSSMQGFSHGHAQTFLVATPAGVISDMGNNQRYVPSQANLSYTPMSAHSPAHPFPYNKGFYVDPTNPLATIYHPAVVPYMTDPHGIAVIPHVLGSSTPPPFPMAPPHLVDAISRPSLDLNGGVAATENGSRGGNARQVLVSVGNPLMQEEMKSSFQPFALAATPMKRREPDGGWDSHNQLGYRQVIFRQ